MQALFRVLFLAVLIAASPALAASLPDAVLNPVETGQQKIVLAGGCFWGVQGVFAHVKGVTQAISGYAGGEANTAHYEMVSNGDTGHAESVQVTYDPAQISLGQILKIYFSDAHDPTELNRQGPDTGPQYRSAIFTTTQDQKKVAEAYINQLQEVKIFSKPIVTTIEPLKAFYAAEDYHQNYFDLHPTQPYIFINDRPKLANLRRDFPQFYVDRK